MGKISSRISATSHRAAAELESLPLYIDDTPGYHRRLRTRARRLKRQKGIGLVIVAISSCPGYRAATATRIASRRFRRSAAASRTLAKELNVR